MANTNLVTN
jgi:hypothetical protein